MVQGLLRNTEKVILQILERLTKLLSDYLGKGEKKLIVLGMDYTHFMQDMREVLMVLHDQSQAYPASVAGPTLDEVAALLRMLKNIISSDYVVKAFHCGRDLDHMLELPEGVSYPLRLVAYKIQDSDDEYSWAISGFQENIGYATPSRSEWQLVIYAEERSGSSGERVPAGSDTPRAEEPIAKLEKVKPNLDLS